MCVELMPRTTYAQKMDALSSQASLAGYVAVVLAAQRIDKVLPMMSTPAGTIAPARVFVLGVGVAGLQAIATAKRLGARVDAYDTRPVVAEQVKSLGARFVEFDLGGEQGQTDQGYAQALTDEQLERAARSDGQGRRPERHRHHHRPGVRPPRAAAARRRRDRRHEAGLGRRRPRRLHRRQRRGHRGRRGGRHRQRRADPLGLHPLPASVARDASQMYAANLVHLIEHAWVDGALRPREDGIVDAVLLTDDGAVRHEPCARAWRPPREPAAAVRLRPGHLPRPRAHHQGAVAAAHAADVGLERDLGHHDRRRHRGLRRERVAAVTILGTIAIAAPRST
jgi:H+-translocating NAD(P) transhydrogenase subunit alpha